MRDKAYFSNTVRQSLILLALAVAVAFAANSFSPNGIPLFGEWDTSKGVITANPDEGIVNHDLEIDSVEAAKKYFDQKNAVFLDARSRDDYARGHIQGALSLPVNEFESHLEDLRKQFDAETYFITYCSGRECEDSHRLAQQLFENGYWEVSVFIDGFPAWEARGYPIEKND
jgi:rhodanese-related sulfurtransferase